MFTIGTPPSKTHAPPRIEHTCAKSLICANNHAEHSRSISHRTPWNLVRKLNDFRKDQNGINDALIAKRELVYQTKVQRTRKDAPFVILKTRVEDQEEVVQISQAELKYSLSGRERFELIAV